MPPQLPALVSCSATLGDWNRGTATGEHHGCAVKVRLSTPAAGSPRPPRVT